MENNQEGTIIIKKTINLRKHNNQPKQDQPKQLLGKVTEKHRKQHQAKSTRQKQG